MFRLIQLRGSTPTHPQLDCVPSQEHLTKPTILSESASHFIDEKFKSLADWRGKTLVHVRALIHAADPEVVEERK